MSKGVTGREASEAYNSKAVYSDIESDRQRQAEAMHSWHKFDANAKSSKFAVISTSTQNKNQMR